MTRRLVHALSHGLDFIPQEAQGHLAQVTKQLGVIEKI